jgi:hypothetical protein
MRRLDGAVWLLAVCVAPAAAAAAPAGDGGPDACALTAPTLARLGFAGLPARASKHERRDLAAVDRAIRTKDLRQAKTALEALARAAPDDVEALQRLATVHARLDDLGAACSDLARLAELDFVAVAGRLDSDAAFVKLKASPLGARLRAHFETIDELWRRGATAGLPAMMSVGARDSLDVWKPSLTRVGVYVHEVRRFLPLAASVAGVSAGLANPATKSVVVVAPDVNECHTDFCPHLASARVLVFDMNDWRRAPLRWRYDEPDSVLTELDVRLAADGTAVSAHDCCCWRDCRSPWKKLGAGASSAARPGDVEARTLSVDFRGALLGLAPAGYRVREGRLSVEGGSDVALARQHADPQAVHAILSDGKSGTVIVFSTIDRCACDAKTEGPIFRWVASTIDLSAKRATVIMEGTGAGAALLDGGGAVYVQTGSTVRRWPSIATFGHEPGEAITPGILLVPPRSPRRDCCGL